MTSPPAAPLSRSERALWQILTQCDFGALTITFSGGETRQHKGPYPGPNATLRLHTPHLAKRLFLKGAMGVAEAYMDKGWSSPDLTQALYFLVVNHQAWRANAKGKKWAGLLDKMRAVFNRNSKRGSRRNISFHYDLGNDFYELWLDRSMTYSSGLFLHEDDTLEEAQRNKYSQTLKPFSLTGKDHLLEIGCGWGGLAEHVGRNRSCQYTGITLSKEQLSYARARIAALDMQERVKFTLKDYRDIKGRYDAIVSIEMLEAVGEDYWPTYFRTLKNALKPGGKAVIQVITIDDALYDSYSTTPDFINRYIFPGGVLPSLAKLKPAYEECYFKLTDTLSFGKDYARTLRLWREKFEDQWGAIAALGYDERFQRMWRYYLSYCEAGFLHGRIDVKQLTFEHAGATSA